MIDLIIKGGKVVTPLGILEVDVGIDGEQICSVAPGSSLPSVEKTIDAKGKMVIPGIIDAHVHTRDPGYTHKEDFKTATQCAAFGGVTMIVDMPNVNPPTLSVKNFEDKKRDCKNKAVVDFNHWASPFRIDEIKGLAKAGTVGFKVFMKYAAYPYNTGASTPDLGVLNAAFNTISSTGLPCMVHPHNQYIYDYEINKLKELGTRDLKVFQGTVYSSEVHNSMVPTLLYLARRAKMKLVIAHCVSSDCWRFIKQSRAEGQEVFAEFNPYFVFPVEKKSPAYGWINSCIMSEVPWYQTGNYLKESWKILQDTDFATYGLIGSDHAPHLEKEYKVDDPLKAHLGWGDLLSFELARFLTEVNRDRITINRLVKLFSENVARLLGLYPKKGAIQVGSDADLTIVDMKKEYTVCKELIHSKCGWSIWEGAKIKGAPVCTIVRGNIVMEDGEVVGKPGTGKFVSPR